MKINIATNTVGGQEFKLYFTAHLCDCIKGFLYEKFNCYDKAYDFLLERYNSILEDKNLKKYVNFRSSKDETSEDKIFSLVCDIHRSLPSVLWSTINKIAHKDKKYYLALFILLDYKINFCNNNLYKSLVYFGKDDVPFVLEMLKDAYENKLLQDNLSIADNLARVLYKDKDIGNDKKNKSINFLQNIEKGINEYIYFEDTDEHLNYFDIYNKNFNIDYKSIVTSEKFIEYIKSNDFDLDDVEDFRSFIECYLEEGNLDCISEISNKIIKEKIENSFFTKNDVMNLDIKEVSLIDF